jgi:hypothetical protein
MNNKLTLTGNELIDFDVNTMSPAQMALLSEKLTNRRLAMMEENMVAMQMQMNRLDLETKSGIQNVEGFVKEGFDNFTGAFYKVKDKFDVFEDEIQKAKEIAITTNRVRTPNYQFVNQSTFGSNFNVSLSSKRVGKLLKVVGIAQPSKNKTTPYSIYIPKLAKTNTTEKYSTHNWHYTECLKKIDKWLVSNGHYDEFYTIESRDDLEKYVDTLYDKYVSN